MDKKADTIFHLNEWQFTLQSEESKENCNDTLQREESKENCNDNSMKSQENELAMNPSTFISIESHIQLGYEIATDDAAATILLHKKITDT